MSYHKTCTWRRIVWRGFLLLIALSVTSWLATVVIAAPWTGTDDINVVSASDDTIEEGGSGYVSLSYTTSSQRDGNVSDFFLYLWQGDSKTQIGSKTGVNISKDQTIDIPYSISTSVPTGSYTASITEQTRDGASESEEFVSNITITVESSVNNSNAFWGKGEYRIYVADDTEADTTTSNITVLRGKNLTTVVINDGVPYVRLDRHSLTYTTLSNRSILTDGFRTVIPSNPVVPIEDKWISLDHSRVFDTKIVTSYDNNGTADYTVYAAAEPLGRWLPVRNANVAKDASGDLYVTNPSTAEVNAGTMGQRFLHRSRVGFDALTTDSNPVSYPQDGDHLPNNAWWSYTKRTAFVSDDEFSNTYYVIWHHWAGVASIEPGGFDATDNTFYAPALGDINVSAPSGYQIRVPSGESSTEYCDGSDNDTDPELPYTRFDEWSLENKEISRTVTFGGTPMDSTGIPGVWNIDNPGNINSDILRIQNKVRVNLTHTYGTDSAYEACPDSETTEYVVKTHTAQASYTLSTVGTAFQEVDIYVVNKSTTNRVYIHVKNPQRFSKGPVGLVHINIAGKDYTLLGPWRFYPSSTHRIVNRVSDDGDISQLRTSVKANLTGDRVPNHYRDYIDLEPFTVEVNELGLYPSTLRVDFSSTAESVPDGVSTVAQNVTVYNVWGGPVSALNNSDMSDIRNAYSKSPFNKNITTTVHYREYKETQLHLTPKNDSILIQLVDRNGTGIDGKQVHLKGTNRSTAITNSSGYIVADPTNPVVNARYNGVSYNSSASIYYESSRGTALSPRQLYKAAGNIWFYAGWFTNQLTLIVEWLVLGIFILWWTQYREQKPR